MATAFMKWLEQRPADYDRGIQLLTLGRLARLQGQLVARHVGLDDRVLEIGSGTGALAIRMAQAGAEVTALDRSAAMVAQAERELARRGLRGRVRLIQADASTVADRFEAESFDRVVISMVLSELPAAGRDQLLRACRRLLAPEGRLLVIEEVEPRSRPGRWLQQAVHLPLRVITWLLTRTSTHPVAGMQEQLGSAGYQWRLEAQQLAGTLQLLVAWPGEGAPVEPSGPVVIGRLAHRVTPFTWLLNLWELVFRIVPPYPKWQPGLYTVGAPGSDAPVLVTGNYDLTLRRLAAAIDGRLDAWVLAVDSGGINVWCAAGGGFLTAERIVGALRASRLEGRVDHHSLILPQLCANGVDGWRLREATGWGVHWGPVKAEDLPAYLAAGRSKTDAMRWVSFPLPERLEMVTGTLGFYVLLLLPPVALLWRWLLLPLAISLIGLSFFYALALPWLPGRDGLAKSLPLAILAVGGMLTYSALFDPVGAPILFRRGVGMVGLAVFVAAEMQGMSPLMRGEQANWGWEAAIGAGLGALYWAVPLTLGWR